MNAFVALVRREFWEHRAFYVVPTIVAVLVVSGFVYGLTYGTVHHIGLSHLVEELASMPQEKLSAFLSVFAAGLAVPFNIALVLVIFFYLLDTLYADRKDRSILFWKSLPVSDTETVLSKFVTALAVLPALTFVAIALTILLTSVALTIAIWIGGGDPWALLWKPAPVFSSLTFLSYAFVVQSLWYAPLFAWLMLASAWAKKAPLLWAAGPPLAIILLEGMMFRSHHFAEFLGHRITGVVPMAFRDGEAGPGQVGIIMDEERIDFSGTILRLADPGAVLTSPGLWGGLLVAGVFVFAAIWLRRYRDET